MTGRPTKLEPQALQFHPLADLFPAIGNELSNILSEHAAEIRRLGKRVIGDIIEIGARLTECKRIAGHGNWLPWLDREFGWTDDTALNFMRAYDLSKSRNFRDLSLPISALYLLAAPSTPDEARDAIIERAEAGETVSVAGVKQTIEEVRREIVARGTKEILRMAKAIRASEAAAHRVERLAKIEAIAAGNTALPLGRKYPVIYADPPWRYERPPFGNEAWGTRYPTMSLEDIRALPVAEIAANDAILFLWATAPTLVEAISVIEAWGFAYVANIVWDKEWTGLGQWLRYQHEHLLIARRGSMPAPNFGEQPASLIRIRRGEHSAKPEEFAELIERMYPNVGRIELFARKPRPGWKPWGNQLPPETEAAE